MRVCAVGKLVYGIILVVVNSSSSINLSCEQGARQGVKSKRLIKVKKFRIQDHW